MESRLRKLLSHRRHKPRRSDASVGSIQHSIAPNPTASQAGIPEVFNQSLRRSTTDKQRESHGSNNRLRALSYEETAPGKPPQLGHRPQRGNGPVKLQTSRRLSSGELLVTEQDYDRTLEEIREGEYVLGGKERRTSKTSSQPKSPTEPIHLKFISTAPNSPRQSAAFSGPSSIPPLLLTGVTPVISPVSASSSINPSRSSFSTQAQYLDYPPRVSSHDGLGVLPPMPQFYAHPMASTTSLIEAQEEHNPTLEALWKAECSRLNYIYGQTGMDPNQMELNRGRDTTLPHERSSSARHRSYSNSSQPPSRVDHLVPSPSKPGVGLKVNASTSNLHHSYRDDHSEGSSQPRYSQLSSSRTHNSAFTTRTSVTDDPSTTRDDIRKIVDDMRTNYLQAIEAHTPPLPPLSSPSMQKPRSKKQTPSLMSHASVESSLRSASWQPVARTKSWQSNNTHFSTPRSSVSSQVIKTRRPASATSRRVSGQQVAGIATLTPIEASPAKSAKSTVTTKKSNDHGLKRADSTTLGVMARKLTIVDDRNSSGSSHATSKLSPTFYHSSGSESELGTDATSPAPSPNQSPAKSFSSLQNTPEKHKQSIRQHSPLNRRPWQIDVDELLEDAEDFDLALDIDDFENLCDGLFNSPSTEDKSKLGIFKEWDNLEKTLVQDKADLSAKHSAAPIASRRPAELRASKMADRQLGLGLSGLPSMI